MIWVGVEKMDANIWRVKEAFVSNTKAAGMGLCSSPLPPYWFISSMDVFGPSKSSLLLIWCLPCAQICPRDSSTACRYLPPISKTLLCIVYGQGDSLQCACSGQNQGQKKPTREASPELFKSTGVQMFSMGLHISAWLPIQPCKRTPFAGPLSVSTSLLQFSETDVETLKCWCWNANYATATIYD